MNILTLRCACCHSLLVQWNKAAGSGDQCYGLADIFPSFDTVLIMHDIFRFQEHKCEMHAEYNKAFNNDITKPEIFSNTCCAQGSSLTYVLNSILDVK